MTTAPAFVLAAAAAILAPAVTALADAAADVQPPEVSAPATGHRFGWQIALVDVGAVGLIAGGGVLTSTSTGFWPVMAVGGAAWFAGGPLVHAAHHDPGGVRTSLLLRTLYPLGTAVAGAGIAAALTSDGPSDVCSHGRRTCAAALGAAVGFGAGMIAAMVHDWVSAEEPRAATSGTATGADGRSVTAALVPLRGGATFSLAGRF